MLSALGEYVAFVAPVISANVPPLILLCHWCVIVAPSETLSGVKT